MFFFFWTQVKWFSQFYISNWMFRSFVLMLDKFTSMSQEFEVTNIFASILPVFVAYVVHLRKILQHMSKCSCKFCFGFNLFLSTSKKILLPLLPPRSHVIFPLTNIYVPCPSGRAHIPISPFQPH